MVEYHELYRVIELADEWLNHLAVIVQGKRYFGADDLNIGAMLSISQGIEYCTVAMICRKNGILGSPCWHQ